MPSSAEKVRKHVQKLKDNGLYDNYKKKRAEREKERRKRLKRGLKKLPKVMREKLINTSRANCRERVKKCRQRKNEENEICNEVASSYNSGDSDYRTKSALSKAVAKIKKTLPASPAKRISAMMKLFHSFNEKEKLQIIGNNLEIKDKPKRGISNDLIIKVQSFYERDDISRISPKIEDCGAIVDPDTGNKEVRQLRYLMYKLSEAYALFIKDYAFEEGNDSNQSNPPLKISKFCALRPFHVKLANELPHYACYPTSINSRNRRL